MERCQGNPFYIEELIHSLIESGTIKPENGGWQIAEMMDAHELPASIQSVILSRLDHLDEDYRQVLLAAAVIGRVFSKKVLQQALPGIPNLENTLWELEGRGLVYQERIIPEVEYSFRHVLMQEAIYHNCLHRRRRILHLGVAQAIERLYSERLEEHFEQLAYHYEKSGNSLKAIDYLEKAGEKATLHFANEAAITSFSKGLELLRSLPETKERHQRELGFLTALGVPLVHVRGHADEQVLEVYTRARDLCQKIGDTSRLFDVLLGLRRYELSCGHLSQAIHLDHQMLALGENHNNSAECARASMMLSELEYYIADFGTILVHSRQGLSLCKDYNASTHIKLYGNDSRLGCVIVLPLALWILGYPDQALSELRREQEILEGISHPFSRAMGLYFASKGYQLLRQFQTVQSLVAEGLQISREHGYALYQNLGLVQLGWSLAAQNQFELGIDYLKQGIDELKRLKLMVFVPELIAPLSEALLMSGQYQAGRAAIEEGIDIAKAMGIMHWLAEMVRLKGEALWRLGDIQGAEDSFKQAIEIARKQQAHSWELRAVASLASLWQEQGEVAQATALLTPVYHWFSEGYESPDLINARALLKILQKT